jgi:peptidoglycan/xylan/chitin deacetylase (PgdA/CDA1 family)
MWQHRFYAIQAMKGDAVYLRELNKVLQQTGVAPISSPARQDRATRAWPASHKDEYTDAVWQACSMPPVRDMLCDLRPYFDWEGLKDWIRRGHTVGLHTHSHPFCSTLEKADLDSELVQPAKELRAQLHLETVPFAYPFGDRLVPSLETDIANREIFSCLLGTGRLSPPTAGPNQIDRIWAEGGLDSELFGRPLAKAVGRTLLGRGWETRRPDSVQPT